MKPWPISNCWACKSKDFTTISGLCRGCTVRLYPHVSSVKPDGSSGAKSKIEDKDIHKCSDRYMAIVNKFIGKRFSDDTGYYCDYTPQPR